MAVVIATASVSVVLCLAGLFKASRSRLKIAVLNSCPLPVVGLATGFIGVEIGQFGAVPEVTRQSFFRYQWRKIWITIIGLVPCSGNLYVFFVTRVFCKDSLRLLVCLWCFDFFFWLASSINARFKKTIFTSRIACVNVRHPLNAWLDDTLQKYLPSVLPFGPNSSSLRGASTG